MDFDNEGPEVQKPIEVDHIEWQASEYIHNEKNFGWYLILFVSTLAVMAVMYLLLKDILSLIVVALMSISLAVYANRKPRLLDYAVNDKGVTIGDKNYSYESFRSFSVMQDGAMENIVLDPLQRLMPPITVYFEQADADRIIDTLSAYLPHEDKELDWVDRFAKRIRF